jgi:polyisoprenoid-binding protein YceI
MATTSKVLFRGAASTSSATLYTTPSATTTVVTNIAVANTASTAATFTLLLDDVEIQKDSTVAANTTAYIDLKQVLVATDTIKGLASATSVDFHISGVEIA